MVTSDLFCSGFGRMQNKMVQGLWGQTLPPTPQTSHPFQNNLVSMLLRLPCSDVDLMVWSGTTYSSGYGCCLFSDYV